VVFAQREHGEDAVAHELQHLAPVRADRADEAVGVAVEEVHDLVPGGGVRDPGEALEVAVPEHGLDRLGPAADDGALEHATRRVGPEIGLEE
jgi:hypothetical protein